MLANSGRNEPRTADANLQATDSPILPHHRQNSFWRGRKEKPRHRHQLKPSTTSPLTDDGEFNPIPEFDTTNEQELRSTTSSPSKSSAAPNVEFRHSRVKTSSDGSSRDTVPLSALGGEQKVWATSRSNGVSGILAMGSLPHSGGTSQEDRISAATAPAILTKTVTASVGPSASSRARQQPNVYKVTQPALISRLPTQANVDMSNEDSVSRDSLSSSSGKKRINKKQLRDLSHIATAVHLVADTRNVSSANFENQGKSNLNVRG